MRDLIVGLDAASDRSKFGFAIGRIAENSVTIEAAGCLASGKKTGSSGLQTVAAALLSLEPGERALVAIDAPLGWPAALSTNLVAHRAGNEIVADKMDLFRRKTDKRLRKLGHQPLEVGADRIARAAVEALSVLQSLRALTKLNLPLAWDPSFDGAAVIEVYPAATLKVRGVQSTKYKERDQADARRAIARALAVELIDLESYVDGPIDAFDACICLLCAKDFLEKRCEAPGSIDVLARQEGWIWLQKAGLKE